MCVLYLWAVIFAVGEDCQMVIVEGGWRSA